MKNVSMVGIDLAKSTFHLQGTNARGKKIFSRKLSRGKFFAFVVLHIPKTAVLAMEACGTAHYWGRKFKDNGYKVKLINPGFVKPYVKSNKNDYNDAEAICEAASRPSMRFVPVKTKGQQEMLSVHRMREMAISQRTRVANQIRSLLAEFGYVTRLGIAALRELVVGFIAPDNESVGPLLKECLTHQYESLCRLDEQKKFFDKKISNFAKTDEACKRLTEIPGIGPICSTALFATVSQGYDFKNGREMSAWLGLVPKQNTTGGKPKLGGISKRGDTYLRKQLIHGARAVVLHRKKKSGKVGRWLNRLAMKKNTNVIVVAMANKNARIAWSLLKHGTTYNEAA